MLPIELILDIFKYIPTRQLCGFMIISRDFNFEIKKTIVERFKKIFWNDHRRLLIFLTRFLLDFVPMHNAFDLTFKHLNNEDLIATFLVDISQPKGTIGPKKTPLWGLKLRGDGLVRDPMNESIYSSSWDVASEQNDARIYVFDSETDSEHPLIRTFYVTRGTLKPPMRTSNLEVNIKNNKKPSIETTNPSLSIENNDKICDKTTNSSKENIDFGKGIENIDGWWARDVINRKNIKDQPRANFLGKNPNQCEGVVGMLRAVRIGAPMVLVAIEEKQQDKGIGGVKYLVMNGGQEYMRRKGCTIS
ncbi:hypothetical protein G9A89_006332 [Geosiphon pyriformis]|nr:hypothetical protein G9A89_006332 [Geosiphon pyriformis]